MTLLGVLAWTAPAEAAQRTYQYSFTEKKQSETFTDTGFCDPGPAQISLTGVNEALHVSATEAGLTREQIEALLEDEGGDVIVRVTHTSTGKFTLTEADGTVYTGRFTFWFGGNRNPNTEVFTGTFNVTGASQDGDRITASFVAHATFIEGELEPIADFERGFVKGCPDS